MLDGEGALEQGVLTLGGDEKEKRVWKMKEQGAGCWMVKEHWSRVF